MGAKARHPSSESDDVGVGMGRASRILRKVSKVCPASKKKEGQGPRRACPASKKKKDLGQERIPEVRVSPRVRKSSSSTTFSISSSSVSNSRGTRSSSRSLRSDVDLMEVDVDQEEEEEEIEQQQQQEEETMPIPTVKMDTKNYCLFCYREEKTPVFAASMRKGDFTGTEEDYKAHIRSLFVKRVAHYLKFDFRQEVTDKNVRSLLQSCLKRSTLKGRNDFQYDTCNDCMTLLSSFCDLHEQSEMIRFKMENTVSTLSRIMKQANRVSARVGPFKQNVLKKENAMGKGEKQIMKCFRNGVMRCKTKVSRVPVVSLRRCDEPQAQEAEQVGQQEEMEINDNLASTVPEPVSDSAPPPAEAPSPVPNPTATTSDASPASASAPSIETVPEPEPVSKAPSPPPPAEEPSPVPTPTVTTSDSDPSPASAPPNETTTVPEPEPVSKAPSSSPPAEAPLPPPASTGMVMEVRLRPMTSEEVADEESENFSSSSSTADSNPQSYPLIDLSSDSEDEDMDLTVPFDQMPAQAQMNRNNASASIPNHDPNHSAFAPPQPLHHTNGQVLIDEDEMPSPSCPYHNQQQRNIAYVQPTYQVQQNSFHVQPTTPPHHEQQEGHEHQPQPPPNIDQNAPSAAPPPEPEPLLNEQGEELIHELTATFTLVRTARSEHGATRQELMRAMMNPNLGTAAAEAEHGHEPVPGPSQNSSEPEAPSSAVSGPIVIESEDEEEEERNRREAAALRVSIIELDIVDDNDDDEDDDEIIVLGTVENNTLQV